MDHGFADERPLLDHFNNRLLRSFRSGNQLEADDVVFVLPGVRTERSQRDGTG